MDKRICRITNDGVTLTAGDFLRISAGRDWLEVQRAGQKAWHPRFGRKGRRWLAEDHGLQVAVSARRDGGLQAEFIRISLTLENRRKTDLAVNLKWTLPLANQEGPVRWLIPALLYKDNIQQRGREGTVPSLVGEPDLAKSRSPWWTFRADLCAVPMVMAWTGDHSVALVLEDRAAGYMTGVGLDNTPGRRALIGCWPYREEPRRREIFNPSYETCRPVITFASLAPGEKIRIFFWLYAGPGDPYAFAPVLRETFARWDDRHDLCPWFPTAEGAAHAAFGLFIWHYDPEYDSLWETCAYDRCYAKNDRQVDRFDMHTGFVSGIPYAHALRQYGLRHGRDDMAGAGRRVIDFCCRNLTPFGTFWSRYSRDEGWTTGWASPNIGCGAGELQARTLADATLFAARAARAETAHEFSRELWTTAVRCNLDFVRRVMRRDGNPGAAYDRQGRVMAWDGEEGLHWISALVEGYRLTSGQSYLDAAIQMGRCFQPAVEDAYLTGAPEAMHLLPTSEDAQNAVLAYVALAAVTRDATWWRLAQLAAELLMTFRWQYNTVLPSGSILERYDFRTKGFDISSPNNVHLHPYGLMALPELVRLWERTGDTYFLKQARNNLMACHQMLAPRDGVFDARRGMMSERWHQTPNGIPKGGTLPLSHAWSIGCVLLADLWVEKHGHVFIDDAADDCVALEAVTVQRAAGGWRIVNPWATGLCLRVVRRLKSGRIARSLMNMPGPGEVLIKR